MTSSAARRATGADMNGVFLVAIVTPPAAPLPVTRIYLVAAMSDVHATDAALVRFKADTMQVGRLQSIEQQPEIDAVVIA